MSRFGGRWPNQDPSRQFEGTVRHWTATPQAKAIPNPFTAKRQAFFEQMGEDEKEFWREVVKQFGRIYYDGDDERSSEKDKRKRGI